MFDFVLFDIFQIKLSYLRLGKTIVLKIKVKSNNYERMCNLLKYYFKRNRILYKNMIQSQIL